MTTKKIGVLNFQYSNHNYGAVLQAAALQHILTSQGHDVEHIDYIPSLFKQRLRNLIRSVAIFIRLIKPRNKHLPKDDNSFERFRLRFLKRTCRVKTPIKFSKISARYDLIVVGSDQVWRPRMAADFAAYLLSYVPEHVVRASYAASFGTSEWEEGENSKLTMFAKSEISKFKYVSCRETSGLEICKNVFNVNAVHVLDPLLQVSDDFIMEVLEDAKPSKEKLVFYKLDQDSEFLSVLQNIENNLAIKACNIYLREGSINKYEEVAQWMRNIYESQVVISDSFHCICLALRFNKKVIYCPNPSRGQARLDDLFDYLDIDMVALDHNNNYKVLSVSSGTKLKLAELRDRSKSFINELCR